jgi:hypothetical protein
MSWALLLTSLKLALKLVIFLDFFFQLLHQITVQKMTFSHARLLEKESSGFSETKKSNSLRLCVFTVKCLFSQKNLKITKLEIIKKMWTYTTVCNISAPEMLYSISYILNMTSTNTVKL